LGDEYFISYAWDDNIPTTELGKRIFDGDMSGFIHAINGGIDWKTEGINPIHAAIFKNRQDAIDLILKAGSPVITFVTNSFFSSCFAIFSSFYCPY